MKNIIEVKIDRRDFRQTVDRWTEEGFQYLDSVTLPHQVNTNEVTVRFEGSRDAVAQQAESGERAFLLFDDGSESPLYIKRERNFWED